MSNPRRQFLGYEESQTVPNIVVDGSPNQSTVLTLTHWPGFAQPPGTDVDTSAEMAFAYLDNPSEHKAAEVVTNNHFDQDGTVGLFALLDPSSALAHRPLLVDLAKAGDFGTYRYRDAARASMVLNAFADPKRSPVSSQLTGDVTADTVIIYEAVLPQVIEIVTDPTIYLDLWAAEDEALSASEEALAQGYVEITEHPDLDLAVVQLDGDHPARLGHRFGHLQVGPIHPMAIHNATDCSRLLTVHQCRFTYTDRYEGWVQLRTRTPPPRVDLGPLAEALNALEGQAACWSAHPPSALTPMLSHEADSTLTIETVLASVTRHLETAPPAWDPYRLS